ncbi:RNA:NAD 2'-phosphotransferase TPT1 [Aspergillus oryzae 100-8]|uniref:2'-phosphotransferase n=1 Tax=Aspergillus oryzae (strain 3.042) TaxID=1160506 RepID=I8U5H0_ASPO3|nr:2'-phosphotransferase TPT1 [Aspergillus oryzae 3.042]KDE79608.1 RNA:NAD 2'-phosphotransferase TPT1 [Aspergillus oryzae 100-8]|eukprot:EIT82130.1 2'-phosphotransferase TPT1 [Aspergillus oryzae 3.042]
MYPITTRYQIHENKKTNPPHPRDKLVRRNKRKQPTIKPLRHHFQHLSPWSKIMGQQRRGKPSGGRDVTVSKALSLLLRHAAEKEGLKLDAQGYANVADVLAWRKLKSLKVTFPEIVAAVATSDKKRFALLHIPSTEAQAQQSTSAEASTEHGIPTTSAGQDSATETALAVSESDLDPAHFLIRATQGHSIKSVDAASLMEKLSLDEEAKLPDTVVHGTFHAAWPAILASGGLKSMGRNQVHFATGPSVESVLAQGAQGSKEVTGDHGEKVISGMRRDAQVLIYIDLKKALAAGCPFWRSENGVILSEGMVVEDSSGIVPVEFFDVVVERKHGLGKIWEGGKEVQALPEELVKLGNPKGRRNANKKKEDTTQP